jgi:glycosyltransferase involved in cell wall biosynthesis
MSESAVALVHDYLTQPGGAERVVLSLGRAFPRAPLYTSLYEAETTFPQFSELDVRTMPLDRIGLLRRRHRLALPTLAPAFSRLNVPADVAVCSSSGWAHGAHVEGRKVVYCHAPARWLYQGDRYLRRAGLAGRLALQGLRRPLERWDRRAAASADRYLANSTATARQIERVYGIEAEVVHPPVSLDTRGGTSEVEGVEPGYVLSVARLLPYKNVDRVAAAFRLLPDERLVVVGTGPELENVRAAAGSNVVLLGAVQDAELRWLYEHASALVSASYEDFGLTPLEVAAFGKPTAALRFGGFLDTVLEGETGVFFDTPSPRAIAEAISDVLRRTWDDALIRSHAASFSEERFGERMRAIVAAERAAG